MKFVITVFSALLALVAQTQAADPVAAYPGKYAKDPAFSAMFKEFERLHADAVSNVKDRLGLAAKNPAGIRVELKDALPANADPIVRYEDAPFRTGRPPRSRSVIIQIHVEFIMSGRYRLDEELRHEMTHAVLRELMGEKVQNGVPQWLHEGLALWCAKQLEHHALAMFTSQEYLERPEAAFPGLEAGEHSFARYPEYALALEFLERRKGAGAIRTLATDLVAGTPYREALEKVSGLGWDEFQKEARTHALARMKELRPPETDEYARLVAHGVKHEWKQLQSDCDDFLRGHPDSKLRPHALYWSAKALRFLKERDRAEAALKEVIDARSCSGFVDDALVQLGFVRLEMGAHAAACESFERLLRDHPSSGWLDEALYSLALCRHKLGEKAEAVRLLGLFERSFPKSKLAPKAHALRESLKD